MGWKILLESIFVGVGGFRDVKDSRSLVGSAEIVLVGAEMDVDSKGALAVLRLVLMVPRVERVRVDIVGTTSTVADSLVTLIYECQLYILTLGEVATYETFWDRLTVRIEILRVTAGAFVVWGRVSVVEVGTEVTTSLSDVVTWLSDVVTSLTEVTASLTDVVASLIEVTDSLIEVIASLAEVVTSLTEAASPAEVVNSLTEVTASPAEVITSLIETVTNWVGEVHVVFVVVVRR